MKLTTILNFLKIYTELQTKEVNIRVAYKLSKLAKAAKENEEFYKENLTKIIQEYGARDTAGKLIVEGENIKLMEDKLEECNSKMLELESLEVEMPDIKLTLAELSDIKISLEQMEALLPFIIEE